jgi:hypothetical protein
MSAILRRAGSKLGKLIARAADPAVVAGRAQIYAKTVSGVAQFFAMAGDGTVTQVSSPSVAPPVYPRYPIPTFTTSTSSFKTLINTEAYANYFGKAGQAITQVTVRLQVLTAGAGLTWAEIAIAKGTPAIAAGTNLTVVGYANVAAVINGLGSKTVAIALSTPLVATDDVWVIYGSSATVTSPALWAGNIGDQTQAGTILQNGASFRPSLNVGVATAFTVSAAGVPTVVAQLWNG